MNFLCQGQHLATREIHKYFEATEFGTFRALSYYQDSCLVQLQKIFQPTS